MAEKKVNTTKTMAAKSVTDAELQKEIDKAKATFDGAKTVKVSIPALLAKNIGATLPLVINGVRIVLPVDGSENEVPEPYAKLLKKYMENLKN